MKVLTAHECGACKALVLRYRRRAPSKCPACSGALAAVGVEVLRLERSDFPKKVDPRQMDLFEKYGGAR